MCLRLMSYAPARAERPFHSSGGIIACSIRLFGRFCNTFFARSPIFRKLSRRRHTREPAARYNKGKNSMRSIAMATQYEQDDPRALLVSTLMNSEVAD